MMSVITPLAHFDIETAVAAYDIGELVDFCPTIEGIENTNYFIRTRSSQDGSLDEFVLTLIEPGSGPDPERKLMKRILDQCADGGLPVAPIIPATSEHYWAKLDNRVMLLTRRLPGEHIINEPSADNCAAMGRFLARMHTATAGLHREAHDYVRSAPWLQKQSARVMHYLSFFNQELLRRSVEAVDSLLQRSDVNRLPQGIIHGDLFRDNVLFNQYGLSGVVDFHHAARGFQIYDLAVMLNDWCWTGEKLDEDKGLEILRGYHSLRPLQHGETTFLPIFLVYAGVSFWLSRLLVACADHSTQQPRVKDPGEFCNIVSCHVRVPFRLDSRALD